MGGSMVMQVSWIDADHLKGLVAQIVPAETPHEKKNPPSPEAEPAVPSAELTAWMMPEPEPQVEEGEVEEIEEIEHAQAAPPPLNRIRDKLQAIRQRASEAGILTHGSAVPSAVATPSVLPELPSTKAPPQKDILPFEMPAGARAERLTAFATWARQILGEDGGHLLVLSEDGEVLCGGEAKASLVLSAMLALGAATRSHAQAACESAPVTRHTLASGDVLTVIPCEVSTGILHAAVVAPSGLDDGVALAIHGALSVALSASSGMVTS